MFISVSPEEEREVRDSEPLIPEITLGMRAGRPLVWSRLIKESDRDSSYILSVALAGCDSDFKDL